MTDILIKRTAENVRFDFDLSSILSAGETIVSVISVTTDQVTTPPLTFGSPVVNLAPIKYGKIIAPTGTVVQVLVSGGVISSLESSATYTLRVDVQTTINPVVEAVATLQLIDAA